MQKRYTDILQKYTNWESIPYAAGLNCLTCGKSGFSKAYYMESEPDKPNLVGWCETNVGLMFVFECPHCFDLYRFHANVNDFYDMDELNYRIKTYTYLVANGEEIRKKFEDYDKE